jgi:hypothetical protein
MFTKIGGYTRIRNFFHKVGNLVSSADLAPERQKSGHWDGCSFYNETENSENGRSKITAASKNFRIVMMFMGS